MPVDQFSFRRQTIAFLGILVVLELAIVLVFPVASVLLGVVAAMTTELGPLWYPIVLLVTSVPCVWLGGKLRK